MIIIRLLKWIDEVLGYSEVARIARAMLKFLHLYSLVHQIWVRLMIHTPTSPLRSLWRKLAPTSIIIPDGQRLYLDDYVIGISAELLLNGGYYERGTTMLFRALANESDTAVDVGAHIGYYTLLAAKKVGEKGKVYAFEPAPDNYKLLSKNVAANQLTNVIVIENAVSDRCEITELTLNEGNSGSNTLNKLVGYNKRVLVETTTLDEYFRGRETSIGLVKIDVEGAEYAVLKGMANIIKMNDNLKIITELMPLAQEAGVSAQDFLNLIESYGFRIYVIDEEKQTVKPVSKDEVLSVWHGEHRRNFYLEKL